VVCGYDYQNITFFSPNNDKRRSTATVFSEAATINDYLHYLATSDYANVKAWDNFIIALVKVINSYSGFINPAAISYSVTCLGDNSISLSGVVDFTSVASARDFFNALYLSLPQDDHPLTQWMEEDGAISLKFSGSGLSTNLYIGRK
jgi:hypothetical protein